MHAFHIRLKSTQTESGTFTLPSRDHYIYIFSITEDVVPETIIVSEKQQDKLKQDRWDELYILRYNKSNALYQCTLPDGNSAREPIVHGGDTEYKICASEAGSIVCFTPFDYRNMQAYDLEI